jgi:hypothetical protein
MRKVIVSLLAAVALLFVPVAAYATGDHPTCKEHIAAGEGNFPAGHPEYILHVDKDDDKYVCDSDSLPTPTATPEPSSTPTVEPTATAEPEPSASATESAEPTPEPSQSESAPVVQEEPDTLAATGPSDAAIWSVIALATIGAGVSLILFRRAYAKR